MASTLSADPDLQFHVDLLNLSYANLDQEGIRSAIQALETDWKADNVESGKLATILSYNTLYNDVNADLALYEQNFPNILNLFITDKHGALAAVPQKIDEYAFAKETWWQFAYNNGNGATFISNPFYDEATQQFAIRIALPIQAESGDVLGVLHMLLNAAPLIDEINALQFGETGHANVYTLLGERIGTPRITLSTEEAQNATINDREPLPASFVLNLKGLVNEVNYVVTPEGNNVNTIFGYKSIRDLSAESAVFNNAQDETLQAIKNLGWHVVVQQEFNEATAPFVTAAIFPILLSIFAALGGVALAYGLVRTTTRQAEVLQPVFSAIESGDYTARAEVFTNDELGETAGAFNQMLDNTVALIQSEEERDAIQSSVMTLLEEVSTVAEGDLTVEAEVRNDVTGAIADSFNFMIEQLRDVIHNVQGATLEVSSSASEIQATAEHLANGSEAQATQIVDTTAAVDEMSISIQQVSENASLSASVGEQARANAQIGSQAVQDTIAGMDRIRDEVETTAERLERLDASSREIGKITRLINDIAERTSILAINASIQASEAGEAGRGFAVVAEEVERLSDRSALAARQINRLTRAIQDEADEVTSAMEATSREVARGSKLAQQAGERLDEIETVSNQLSDLIQSISQAAQQQARGSEAIAQSMNEIAGVTQQTAAGTKQATSSIGKLAQLADELRDSVSQFKIRAEQQPIGAAD